LRAGATVGAIPRSTKPRKPRKVDVRTILMIRCYKQNGHKAWVVLRDVGGVYDILMGVLQSGAAEPEIKQGKSFLTLVEALVDFKARCNFYVENSWTADSVFQKLLDGLIG
jgi:hypothetical protein